MLTRFRRPGVLPAVMLVIIILWALLAVWMLTNTLVTANQIDNRVEVINGEVGPIDNELDSVVLAGQVAQATEQIRPAAAPLTRQLTTTNEHVVEIDASAEKILETAGLINGTAGEINSTVQQINTNVNSIGGTLNSVESSAVSIGDSVDGINASFGGTLSEVVSIDDRVAMANGQIVTLVDQIRGIGANVANVDNVQVPAILFNAKAIHDNPLLLNTLGEGPIPSLNTLAALGMPAPSAAEQLAPLPVVPDLAELPAPVQLPVPEIAGVLPLGPQQPQQSAENDSGSILGGLLGGS